MMANQLWLDVVANNLANVNTTGFKRDGIQFSDWMERKLFADGGNGAQIGTLGAGPAPFKPFVAWNVGTMSTTDNPLDFAITTEKGVFAIQAPSVPGGPNPNIVYTRDGSFQLNADGQIVDKHGWPLLDENMKPITLDTGQIPAADEMGNVGPTKPSDDGTAGAMAKIGLFEGEFTKLGDNLFTSKNAKIAADARIQPRTLEGSNVNTVETMIQMITVSRSFELAQKSITTQDEMTGRLIESLRGG